MDKRVQERAPARRGLAIPRWLSVLVAIAFMTGAIVVIGDELRHNSPAQILEAFRFIAPGVVAGALALVLVSYACLICCERIALSMMGRGDIPLRRIWRPTFTAYALGNAVGLSYATVPAARARLYKDYLSAGEIAALSAVSGGTVMIAGAAAAGVGFILASEEIAAHVLGAVWLWRLVGLALVAPACAWIATAAGLRGQKKKLFTLQVPRVRIAIAQVAMGIVDWGAAAGVLYVLLPGHGGWSYPAFVAVFVVSGVIAAVSGAPAGVGVFEASILALSPNTEHAPAMAAALIVYRLVWTVAPLIGAAILLAYDMLRARRVVL